MSSALAIALATALAHHQQPQPSPQQPPMAPPSPSSSASVLSSSPSCSSLSSSSTRSSCSDASVASSSGPPHTPLRVRVDQLASPLPRPNEHLAVLLPRQLWKADKFASHCDNFYCRVPFSVFERRHHCRKCGGIFCRPCSTRTTPLLDASRLDFLHPPRNQPLTDFQSDISPIAPARVCDDCFDQIHGCRTPELPRPPSPIALFKSPSPRPASPASAMSVSPPTPSSVLPPATGLSRRPRPVSRSSLSVRAAGHLPLALAEERSYGELDAYPLKRSSVLCKAAGGGRWEPTPPVVMAGTRVPVIGGKAPYEIEMEREEAEERRRRSNPVVRDGDFQYRYPAPCESEPVIVARVPLQLSTF
ncbi:FYVE zinc finger-domain-containing protein [Mycena sp. CBHHK59/15]|nr:FYVE zinc finger-domain-containing protein [Mycena sp. CBHHK59/15]